MLNLPADPRGAELLLMVERAKYERWLAAEVSDMLEREFNEVVDVMTSRTFRSLSQFDRSRTLQLFRELDRVIKAGYVDVSDLHIREMSGYASLESEVALETISSVISAAGETEVSLSAFLPEHTVRSIAALPIQGLRLGDWFQGQAETMSRETRRLIQHGLIEGRGPADIIRQIIPARGSVEPSVYRRARNEATAVTRTTVTAVQNHAAQESYSNLPKSVSEEYRYTAIRDSRTTAICRGLDGKVYRYDDEKKKVPPQHIGCRSSTIPIVKDENGKTIELSKAPHTFGSYNDWLKAQGIDTQNRILGRERADLWRSGKATLADMIDDDNRVLSLPQLRKRLNSGVPPTPAAPAAPPPPPPRRAPALNDFITGKSIVGIRGLKSGINLPGIRPPVIREITEAFDAVLSPYGIKIDGVAITASRSANGLYSRARLRLAGASTYVDQIAFKKSWVNSLNDAASEAEAYIHRRDAGIERFRQMMAGRNSPDILRRLAEMEIPTRWSVPSTSERHAFSTAAHEAGHALMFRGQLEQEWRTAVRAIPRSVRLRVSEYAASDPDELWAEITALVAENREAEVPAELIRLYRQTLTKIRVIT